MWLFYLMFLLPIGILIARIIIILSHGLWAATEANVLKNEFETRIFRGKFPSVQDDVVSKILKVTYEYEVNEKTYTSSRISMGILDKLYREEDLASDIMLNSIESGKVKIQYIKHFPCISVITRSPEDTSGDACLIFALALVMSISMFAIYIGLAPQ